MELDEWEYLPNDGLLDLHEDVHGGNNFISLSSNPKSVVDMNYFQKFIDPQHKKNSNNYTRAVPVVPIQLDPKIEEIPVDEKEILEDPSSKETISQVFFKKLKENEFVDMKMDNPKSLNRGIMAQTDLGTCQFEKKEGDFGEESVIKDENGSKMKAEDVTWDDDDNNNGGLNIWKWAMTGIGAVVSFGVAAATVSLIVLGNRHREQHHKSYKLHFQIYPHEKRINQVVHHAKKLNEAISAVRGAPLTRAQITIGGYYDGL